MEVLQVSPMLAQSLNRLSPRGGFDQFDAQIDNIFAQSDHNQLRCIDVIVTIKDAQSLKRTLIQPYLRGVSRNEIESRTGISQGSVSNITTGWKTGLGYPEPDDLRDLGIMIKNAGMTAPQAKREVVNSRSFSRSMSYILKISRR